MTVRDRVKPSRRKRSPNGVQRSSKVWSVRGVEDPTIADAQLLSTLLDAPIGRVIDEAIGQLMRAFTTEAAQSNRKCMTLPDDFSWLLDTNFTPSNDPKVVELKQRLASRRYDRDVMMGRTPS